MLTGSWTHPVLLQLLMCLIHIGSCIRCTTHNDSVCLMICTREWQFDILLYLCQNTIRYCWSYWAIRHSDPFRSMYNSVPDKYWTRKRFGLCSFIPTIIQNSFWSMRSNHQKTTLLPCISRSLIDMTDWPHLSSHKSRLMKLFWLPRHPLYLKRWHVRVAESKYQRSRPRLHEPSINGSVHASFDDSSALYHEHERQMKQKKCFLNRKNTLNSAEYSPNEPIEPL